MSFERRAVEFGFEVMFFWGLGSCLRSCLKTEGLTRICADEADCKNRQKQEQRQNTGILHCVQDDDKEHSVQDDEFNEGNNF